MMITGQDLFLVAFLAFLEGILSIDNALVLAMMCRHLPKEQQRRALTYGLVGAVFFRLAALAVATQLIQWTWVKYVGGAYLVFIALKHFLKKEEIEETKPTSQAGFWKTVIMVELMDIAFAVDSILAAVALTSKFWIVFAGGFMGVIMMRYAASVFLVLLRKFPRFEKSAYILILLIGSKLILEAARLPGIDFHGASQPAFWIFWGLMLATIAYGFRRPKAPVDLEAKSEVEAKP